jgi:hypothetical protein
VQQICIYLSICSCNSVWDLVRYTLWCFDTSFVVQGKEDLGEVPGGSSKSLCLQAKSWPMSLAPTNGESVWLVERYHCKVKQSSIHTCENFREIYIKKMKTVQLDTFHNNYVFHNCLDELAILLSLFLEIGLKQAWTVYLVLSDYFISLLCTVTFESPKYILRYIIT